MDAQKKKKKGYSYFQWIFCILSNLTLFVYGIACGWVSPTAKFLQSGASPTGYPLTDDEIAWIASSMSMAAVFGVSLCAFVCDRYGRKIGVIQIAALEAISWIIRLLSPSFLTLIMARVCAGLAAGGCFTVAPMYIKEISQEDLRGILGTIGTLFASLGIFFVYVVGAYLDYYTVVYIIVGIPILTILVMIKAPESPEFLIKQGKVDEATATIAFLRGLDKDDSTVQSIVATMVKQEAHFKSLPDLTLISILKRRTWRRGFLYGIVAVTWFELNGSYAIIIYASSILSSTGVQFEISPEIQAVSFPVVMILGSLVLASCIERFGRKTLLAGVYLIASVSMFTLAVIIIVQKQIGGVPAWLPVTVMMLVVATFSGGASPITFIVLTEMFNFQIRAKLMGVILTYNWLLTFVILRIYPPLVNMLGAFAPFIFYGITNLLAALFTIFYLAETKGKSEEEVMESLGKKKKIMKENTV